MRRLERRDVEGVMGLYEKAIVPLWKDEGRDFDLARVEENILANLDNPDYSMSVEDGEEGGLVGYLAWERHSDHTSGHIIAHLRMILVHPDRRRQGLASSMIEAFEAEARGKGCTKVLFDVLVGSPANQFYKEIGYHHWSNYMEKRL